MKKFPIALGVVTALLLSASAGFAQEKGGVRINGVASNTTVANGNVNAASGFLAEAHQSIGAIRGGTQVNGVLANTTVANGNVNAASGFLAEAKREIGVIGDSTESGKVDARPLSSTRASARPRPRAAGASSSDCAAYP